MSHIVVSRRTTLPQRRGDAENNTRSIAQMSFVFFVIFFMVFLPVPPPAAVSGLLCVSSASPLRLRASAVSSIPLLELPEKLWTPLRQRPVDLETRIRPCANPL